MSLDILLKALLNSREDFTCYLGIISRPGKHNIPEWEKTEVPSNHHIISCIDNLG